MESGRLENNMKIGVTLISGVGKSGKLEFWIVVICGVSLGLFYPSFRLCLDPGFGEGKGNRKGR